MTAERRGGLVNAILKAGLVAGTLDIAIALLYFYYKTGKDPLIVPRYIASAVFGKEKAYANDDSMIVYGFLFHFLIAFGWTILFFIIYPRIRFLQKNIIITAVLYGLFVWLMMNRVVVPMTKIPPVQFDFSKAWIQMLILIIAIGFPVSFFAKRYYSGK